jgi:hypothetical protein
MPSKRQERLERVQAIVKQQGWPVVDLVAFRDLCERFPEVSAQTLRRDLRETTFAVHPLVEGVRLCSLATMQRTMLALHDCYPDHPREVRRLMLDARRKAEHVTGNPKVHPTTREQMAEKLLWLRVWLENPALFPAWAQLRRRSLASQLSSGNQTGGCEHP